MVMQMLADIKLAFSVGKAQPLTTTQTHQQRQRGYGRDDPRQLKAIQRLPEYHNADPSQVKFLILQLSGAREQLHRCKR
jgi:hypothetical protein